METMAKQEQPELPAFKSNIYVPILCEETEESGRQKKPCKDDAVSTRKSMGNLTRLQRK